MENQGTKSFIYLIIIVLVVAAGVLAIVAMQSLRSPQQVALSQYVRDQYAIQPGLVVSQVVQAGHPEAFTSAMSGPVIGSSSFYQTGTSEPLSTPGSSVSQTGSLPQSLRPLPYPPQQLECVLLSSNKGDSVVFVALHQDMYNAQWLVHQARYSWLSSELQAQLATLGCAFPSP